MATAIFYPVFAQIVLTIALLLGLGAFRRRAIQSGRFEPADLALDDLRLPARARQVANCYRNQFELPVIFYVLCLVAFETGSAGSLMVILAWLFVLLRVVHAYIHTTSNVVMLRGAVFAAGLIVVLLMLLLIVAHLATAAA